MLPRDPYLLNVYPQPGQFLLHAELLDDADGIVDDVGWEDGEGLADDDKLCVLEVAGDFY